MPGEVQYSLRPYNCTLGPSLTFSNCFPLAATSPDARFHDAFKQSAFRLSTCRSQPLRPTCASAPRPSSRRCVSLTATQTQHPSRRHSRLRNESLARARARDPTHSATRNVLRRSSRVPRRSRPRRRALPRPRSLPRRRPCRALIASSPGACPSESSSRWPCRSGPFVMRCQPPSRGGRRAR